MKERERIVIKHLRNNARDSIKKLSDKKGIPATTLYDQIKSYESNLIKKNVSLLDFKKFGLNVEMFISLIVDEKSKHELIEYLGKNVRTNSLFKVNNNGLFFHGLFKNFDEYENTMANISSSFEILEKKVYYINSNILQEHFLSQDIHFNML